MKKYRVMIPLLIAICFCVIAGFTTIPVVRNFVAEENKTAEQSKENEQTDNTKNDSTNSKIVGSEEVILSAEDKAVKAEIAKYSNTSVEFKYNRKEKIGDKTYDLIFDRVGFAETNNDAAKRVTYKNLNGDEFIYNTDTGKLRMVTFLSNIANENEKTISIQQAEKLAAKYASEKCDISQYTLVRSEEMFRGYDFLYSRFVDGYETTDNVGVTISFDGNIVYLGDATDTFDKIELKINEEWIDKKTHEALSYYDEGTAIIKEKYITVKNQKPYLMITVSYGVAPDGTIGTGLIIHEFCFEE